MPNPCRVILVTTQPRHLSTTSDGASHPIKNHPRKKLPKKGGRSRTQMIICSTLIERMEQVPDPSLKVEKR